VGAVFGQIAGAHYGMSGIPTKWLDKLVDCQMMIEMADQLLDLELVADIC
jgi:ADP-ribosylglycohydrolase